MKREKEERMENGTGNCYLVTRRLMDALILERKRLTGRRGNVGREPVGLMGLNSGSKTSPPAIFFSPLLQLRQLDRSDLINILIPPARSFPKLSPSSSFLFQLKRPPRGQRSNLFESSPPLWPHHRDYKWIRRVCSIKRHTREA